MLNKLGEFPFLPVCRMLPSFAPFKCTSFLYCVRELRITVYNEEAEESIPEISYTKVYLLSRTVSNSIHVLYRL
jgi:hypothetical protein